MNLLRVLICKVKGHKRGKRVFVYTPGDQESDGARKYECPRCRATWVRKVSKAKTA